MIEPPAIALVELDSIAVGVLAGDAMVKRAPVEFICAGTAHPGKYLVLVGGDVASVEEAFAAGIDIAGAALLDRIFLPAVHPAVVASLRGRRAAFAGEALGVVETRTAAATVGAADRGLKGAEVMLAEIRLADRLGGKAYCVFSGAVADVEEAVELAAAGLERPQSLVARVVIPQFHGEMLENLAAASDFGDRIGRGGV
jgi:microcompartment protein CcmL/EutN